MKKPILKVINLIDNFFNQDQIPILYYHRVNDIERKIDPSPTTSFFEDQIKYILQRGYYIASLTEIISWCQGNIMLPKKSIAITFDDGYLDNYDNAFPILQKYNAKATIFLIYNYIGKSKYFSYNREKPQKILPEDYNPAKDIKHSYLTKKHVKEMHASGLIEFGSHSLSHVSLTFNDLAQAQEEIKKSKVLLEKLLNIPVDTFCYPYGHFNETIKKMTREAGYKGAVTTRRAKINKGDDIFALPRWNDINRFVNLPPLIRKIDKFLY